MGPFIPNLEMFLLFRAIGEDGTRCVCAWLLSPVYDLRIHMRCFATPSPRRSLSISTKDLAIMSEVKN